MGIFNKKKKAQVTDFDNVRNKTNVSQTKNEVNSNQELAEKSIPDVVMIKKEEIDREGKQMDTQEFQEWNQSSESESFISNKIKPYSEKLPVDHTIGITQIIAIINQKGGVGKTTTALNLSAALGEQGKEVLLVDLDPQGNATSGLGVEKNEVEYCIYDALLNDVNLEKIIIPDVYTGLDLVPATINLAGAEVELVTAIARENRLKDALGKFRGKYDYIIIDCPPSLGLLTINSFVAADSLIIPIQTEFYALEGVTKLLESMKLVKSRLNPSLEIFGVVLTMYDARTTLAKQVANEVRSYFGSKVFQTEIPRTVRLSEAPSFGQPITQYEPDGKGARSYTKLAKEVINNGK